METYPGIDMDICKIGQVSGLQIKLESLSMDW